MKKAMECTWLARMEVNLWGIVVDVVLAVFNSSDRR
jgi:hypothetical protein